MANTKQPEEVQVLHFFETAPIEKAEAIFNIVSEKMRERVPNRPVASRKQRPKKTDDTASRSGERQEQDASTRTGHD